MTMDVYLNIYFFHILNKSKSTEPKKLVLQEFHKLGTHEKMMMPDWVRGNCSLRAPRKAYFTLVLASIF